MNPSIPHFLYGTAWKEERTEALVLDALDAGFVGIDTANQRKHYFEEGVGKGFQAFLKKNGKKRESFFLQTKFTYERGQDHRLPYDSGASFSTQVEQSFASSLEHFGTDYLDSYVLHGPYGYGIHDADYEVWKAMEKLHQAKKTKHLGISNVGLDQLETMFEFATIKPTFVQNRCYARKGWDRDVRTFCLENKMIYQGFSLLTANMHELSQSQVQKLAAKYRKTIPQLVFRFAQQVGMLPLTGTSDSDHMKQDLDIQDFSLNEEEISFMQAISF